MKFDGGISNLTVLGIVSTCAAPAITLNVWPRIEGMLATGMSSNEVGIVLLVTVSALGMTSVPFAMKKSSDWGFWLVCLSFGIGLAVLNYIMAVGAIGKMSDNATSIASATISKAESLKNQLEELRVARKELGSFKPATIEMLTAADEAVKLARDARDQECNKVGDFCRARVAQLQSRLSERADIASATALTRRAVELDQRYGVIQRQASSIGAVPVYADPQAERIRAVLQLVAPGIATPTVANAIIHFLAISAELFALGMPRIIATALGKAPTAAFPKEGQLPPLSLRGRQRPILAAGSGTPAIAGPPAPAIKDWLKLAIKSQPNERIDCWNLYSTYKLWCKSKGLPAVTFTSFDFEAVENGLKKEVGKQNFYLDVRLV